MKNILYIREYPNGSNKISKEPFSQSESDAIYFDDILFNCDFDISSMFVISKVGHEKSYPDRTLEKRKTRYGLLHYVLGGKGKFNGVEISANQAFITFPFEEHSIISDKFDPWHFGWIAFAGTACDALFSCVGLTSENNVFNFDYSKEVAEIFLDIVYSEHTEVDIDKYLLSRVLKLLSLYTSYSSVKQSVTKPAKTDYAREAKRYIYSRYNEIVKIDSVAKHLHISRKYLCSVFKVKYNMSPQHYLIKRRLEVAASMLINTELSISELADAVGYTDYTQLSRLFKRHYGCSLTEYRKKYIFAE